mmetsp:Transcript_13572/g.20490  ORF Transcript_13572/g.20490 Transcript_13572/m.20490 type:complete len:221 (-) Transcript_13572:1324-1986(-)
MRLLQFLCKINFLQRTQCYFLLDMMLLFRRFFILFSILFNHTQCNRLSSHQWRFTAVSLCWCMFHFFRRFFTSFPFFQINFLFLHNFGFSFLLLCIEFDILQKHIFDCHFFRFHGFFFRFSLLFFLFFLLFFNIFRLDIIYIIQIKHIDSLNLIHFIIIAKLHFFHRFQQRFGRKRKHMFLRQILNMHSQSNQYGHHPVHFFTSGIGWIPISTHSFTKFK